MNSVGCFGVFFPGEGGQGGPPEHSSSHAPGFGVLEQVL